MSQEKFTRKWFPLSAGALIVAIAKAIAMTGDPYRLVNGVMIMLLSFAAGAFYARGIMERRAKATLAEAPGSPPASPK